MKYADRGIYKRFCRYLSSSKGRHLSSNPIGENLYPPTQSVSFVAEESLDRIWFSDGQSQSPKSLYQLLFCVFICSWLFIFHLRIVNSITTLSISQKVQCVASISSQNASHEDLTIAVVDKIIIAYSMSINIVKLLDLCL